MEEQTKDTAGLKGALVEARDRTEELQADSLLTRILVSHLVTSLCGAMGTRRKPLRCSALHRAATARGFYKTLHLAGVYLIYVFAASASLLWLLVSPQSENHYRPGEAVWIMQRANL